MPSNTTSRVPGRITAGALPGMLFHYVYVFESMKDGNRYTGYTMDLKRRLEEHKKRNSVATKHCLPVKRIYFEGCINEQDAKRREKYLKTTQGRRFLGLRLSEYKRQSKHRSTFGAGS